MLPSARCRRAPPRSTRPPAGPFGLEPLRASFRALRIRESSSNGSPVRQGTTLTRTESVSVNSPIVTVAFIHPDFEQVRVHAFSHHPHWELMPPVPTSGRHCHIERFQAIGGSGAKIGRAHV